MAAVVVGAAVVGALVVVVGAVVVVFVFKSTAISLPTSAG